MLQVKLWPFRTSIQILPLWCGTTTAPVGPAASQPPVRCLRCNGINHYAKDCTAPMPAHLSGAVGARTCYKCQKEGHLARDCPQADVSSAKICYHCREGGHVRTCSLTPNVKTNP
ncbi:uncharacterized protein EI90DRAFT_430841 [Cantharellus anzutake]|uniref:uncharacterized protein n=1 Tax=Cantharellus anzutake TaxID=1750568 RepID=UPI001904B670|nr:uncharacterized protein EI90DRAFT_430841 [Cantharellus anzutake]KAF8314570.1 hypothetical protein EI90DRAFT_430841 [Cantharellus anzutake]